MRTLRNFNATFVFVTLAFVFARVLRLQPMSQANSRQKPQTLLSITAYQFDAHGNLTAKSQPVELTINPAYAAPQLALADCADRAVRQIAPAIARQQALVASH